MARYRTQAYTKENKRLKDYANDFDSLTQLKIRLKDIFMFDVRIDRLKVYDKHKFLYEYAKRTMERNGKKVVEIYRLVKEEQFVELE